jgi:hypothetical protein
MGGHGSGLAGVDHADVDFLGGDHDAAPEDARRWTVTGPAGAAYAALADDYEVTMLVVRTGQCWYQRHPLRSSLGYQSPVDYGNNYLSYKVRCLVKDLRPAPQITCGYQEASSKQLRGSR